MSKNIVVVCNIRGELVDLLIPDDIQANRLVQVLDAKFRLSNRQNMAIRCENPIALICGEMPVSYFGLHDGSTLYL